MNRRHTLGMLSIALIGILVLAVAGPASTSGEDGMKPRKRAAMEPAQLRPAFTPAEQALEAIQLEGRQRVREVAARLAAESDPARRAELRKQGVAIKLDYRLRFLETLARFARERGDFETEQAALGQIDDLKNPRRARGTPIRQTPDKAEIQKGGK